MKRRPAASLTAGRPMGHVKEEKLIAVLQWMEAHGNRKPNKTRSGGKDEQSHAHFLERARKKAHESPEVLSARSKELLAQIKELAKSEARQVPLPGPEPSSSSSTINRVIDFATPPRKRSKVTGEGIDVTDHVITSAATDTPGHSEDVQRVISTPCSSPVSATPIRSPAAARTLAEGPRSKPSFAEKLAVSDKKGRTRRPCHTSAIPAAEFLKGQSREWITRLYDHVIQLRTEASDQSALPRRRLATGGNNPQYKCLERARAQYQDGQLKSSEFLLLAQLEGVLNTICRIEQTGEFSWCWTFAVGGLEIQGSNCDSKTGAEAELSAVRQELYPEWADVPNRPSHLSWVKHMILERHNYQYLEVSSAMSRLMADSADYASKLVRHSRVCVDNAVPGFWNPGWSCCYLNATLQCLLSCQCIREYITNASTAMGVGGQTSSSDDPAATSNPMLQRMHQILTAYLGTSCYDVGKPLLYETITPAPVLDMLLRWQGSDAAGRQQDAAEQLGNLLTMTGMDVALGVSHAELVQAGQLICKTPARAEISERASPVDMYEVLQEALREQNLQEAPKLLVICLDNTYEQGDSIFWVTARVSWSPESISLEHATPGSAMVKYRLRGYIEHKHGDPTPSRGMQSGHYVAYLCCSLSATASAPDGVQETVWVEADDDRVRRLATPPCAYPYVVFYELASQDPDPLEKRIREARSEPVALATSAGQIAKGRDTRTRTAQP